MGRYEQPKYSVVATTPDYEIRHYEGHLVAETVLNGGFESTGNMAFQRLAGFIFGQNSEGRKMNMTVPVTHQPTPDGGQRYRFVMESAYTEETLPSPIDRAVEIVRISGGYYAAMAYRGGRGEQRYRRAEAALLAALERDGLSVTGPVEAAVYDGPATPPFLRHNEVLVPIERNDQSSE
jgi:effector-binding domain-containing protein